MFPPKRFELSLYWVDVINRRFRCVKIFLKETIFVPGVVFDVKWAELHRSARLRLQQRNVQSSCITVTTSRPMVGHRYLRHFKRVVRDRSMFEDNQVDPAALEEALEACLTSVPPPRGTTATGEEDFDEVCV